MFAPRFGIFSFAQGPYENLLNVWRRAEELGFDSAWTADDLNLPGKSDFEPWSLLGALARDTTRIRIGTLVTVITFRHPSFLAAQVVTVDHLSGGRVELGIGAGGPPNPYGAYGHDGWSATERMDRLAEQVPILEALLRGETVNTVNEHYSVRDAQVPRSLQQPRPPITVAAHGARGIHLAAERADGWNSLAGQPYPEGRDPDKRVTLSEAVDRTRQRSDMLDAYCAEIGRDPATIRRSIAAIWPTPDPLSSVDAFDDYVGRYHEIGIDQIIFYWPPQAHIRTREPISPAQWAMFERIATDRIARYRSGS